MADSSAVIPGSNNHNRRIKINLATDPKCHPAAISTRSFTSIIHAQVRRWFDVYGSHWHEQSLTGHCWWRRNHSSIWIAWPPCLHDWHHVNHRSKPDGPTEQHQLRRTERSRTRVNIANLLLLTVDGLSAALLALHRFSHRIDRCPEVQ
jgi:hypothetical protein